MLTRLLKYQGFFSYTAKKEWSVAKEGIKLWCKSHMWMPSLSTLRLQLIAATDALDLLGTLSDVTEIAIIIFSFCSLKEVTSDASQLLPNHREQKFIPRKRTEGIFLTSIWLGIREGNYHSQQINSLLNTTYTSAHSKLFSFYLPHVT